MRDGTVGRRTRAALLALAALGASGAGCGLMPPEDTAQPAPAEKPADPAHGTLPPAGYALVLDEPFDGSALDASRWTAMDGPRRDARATPAAVAVSGGVLTLTTSTEKSGVHETGFVTSEGKFLQRRGYFEARIRFHDAPGSWCAFWLLSPTIGVPQGDPAKAGSEIDVVEHRVTDHAGWDALADMVQAAVNWDGYANRKNVNHVGALPGGARVQGEWHTYGVLWTAEGYTFYVDGVAFWSTTTAVSNVAQDVRLTCEVDDGSWAGDVPAGGYGPRGVSTTRMDVDWVRVWAPPQ